MLVVDNDPVSMESGLEGRNNILELFKDEHSSHSLNGVRPRRPEQFCRTGPTGWPESSLNGVRPRRPEQFDVVTEVEWGRLDVSMESGLEGRNNASSVGSRSTSPSSSQWSPA